MTTAQAPEPALDEPVMTIAEAAAAAGVSVHTLRYYERAGLLFAIGRNGSGHRRFSRRDLDWIDILTKLRATGMPIRRMREYAELVRAGEGNEAERLALLEEHREEVRARMRELRRNLERIDYKIDLYRSRLAAAEAEAGDRALTEVAG